MQDTVLQVESHHGEVEQQNDFPLPAAHASFDSAVILTDCNEVLGSEQLFKYFFQY